MPLLGTDVAPLDVLTDRWLIEALSLMSSNPRVRGAAAAWLVAHRTALKRGFAEEEAQSQADAALRRQVDADPPQFGYEHQESGAHSAQSGGQTNG